MQEKLLHFIWQNLLFNLDQLKTTDLQPVQIHHKGTLNVHAGPDFTNAKITIDNTLWVGDVEIHIQSGDWHSHGHTKDRAYDATILHVCWNEDNCIYRTDGTKIPCLTLSNRVAPNVLNNYEQLMSPSTNIPCKKRIDEIDNFTWKIWLQRLAIERLESKTIKIDEQLKISSYDWQTVFYVSFAKSMGLKINAQPFEQLAHFLPQKIVSKHMDHLFQIEALTFGVAGFLNDEFTDDYGLNLQKEYRFLKKKYPLQELHKSDWKFLRLMPANFPTLRLAQFSALMHQSTNLFKKMMYEFELKKLMAFLKTSPSPYWETHYRFEEPSSKKLKPLGTNAIQSILINTIVPIKFAYGKHIENSLLQQNAFDILEKLGAENNAIIQVWKNLGLEVKNSLQSQAFLQLKNEYCNSKRCLHCSIGYKLLKK
jgi:hypothetical protein